MVLLCLVDNAINIRRPLTFSMSRASTNFNNVVNLKSLPSCTDFAVERSVLIQILVLIGKINNSDAFSFSLAKVEAKPSSK